VIFELRIFWSGGGLKAQSIMEKDFANESVLIAFVSKAFKDGLEIRQGAVLIHIPGPAISLIESREL